MSVLNFTPAERMVDERGRPYFLWDSEMTLEEFRSELAGGNRATRAYLVGKLMRQAKPDDVFQFVTANEIRELWSDLQRYLGRSREFWTWILGSEQWTPPWDSRAGENRGNHEKCGHGVSR